MILYNASAAQLHIYIHIYITYLHTYTSFHIFITSIDDAGITSFRYNTTLVKVGLINHHTCTIYVVTYNILYLSVQKSKCVRKIQIVERWDIQSINYDNATNRAERRQICNSMLRCDAIASHFDSEMQTIRNYICGICSDLCRSLWIWVLSAATFDKFQDVNMIVKVIELHCNNRVFKLDIPILFSCI